MNSITKIDTSSFQSKVLENKQPVLIDFFASWCQPCEQVATFLEELVIEDKSLLIFKIDLDEAMDLASKYKVLGLPTVILFEKGKEKGRVVGADLPAIRNLAYS